MNRSAESPEPLPEPLPERVPERVMKVLVAGPVGVGKTTAVKSASDVPILTTETTPTDDTLLLKPSTTVALDFGVARLDDVRVVHLYGTPGQKRFDFMWEILRDGSAGVVILVDASDPDAIEGLGPYLETYAALLEQRRVALGVTRLEVDAKDGLAPFRSHLGRIGASVPVFEVDPRSRADVLVLIRALLATTDVDLMS